MRERILLLNINYLKTELYLCLLYKTDKSNFCFLFLIVHSTHEEYTKNSDKLYTYDLHICEILKSALINNLKTSKTKIHFAIHFRIRVLIKEFLFFNLSSAQLSNNLHFIFIKLIDLKKKKKKITE